MDKIILYKNGDGNILQATDFELVDRTDLVEKIETARRTLHRLQDTLDKYDKLARQPAGTDTTEETELHGVEDGDGHIVFTQKPVGSEPPLTPSVPIQPIII